MKIIKFQLSVFFLLLSFQMLITPVLGQNEEEIILYLDSDEGKIVENFSIFYSRELEKNYDNYIVQVQEVINKIQGYNSELEGKIEFDFGSAVFNALQNSLKEMVKGVPFPFNYITIPVVETEKAFQDEIDKFVKKLKDQKRYETRKLLIELLEFLKDSYIIQKGKTNNALIKKEITHKIERMPVEERLEFVKKMEKWANNDQEVKGLKVSPNEAKLKILNDLLRVLHDGQLMIVYVQIEVDDCETPLERWRSPDWQKECTMDASIAGKGVRLQSSFEVKNTNLDEFAKPIMEMINDLIDKKVIQNVWNLSIPIYLHVKVDFNGGYKDDLIMLTSGRMYGAPVKFDQGIFPKEKLYTNSQGVVYYYNKFYVQITRDDIRTINFYDFNKYGIPYKDILSSSLFFNTLNGETKFSMDISPKHH